MSWGFSWRPYVPVAQRRANAAREVAKMSKRGKKVAPVVLKSKSIATTFWGKAWCDNLEAYSDFANRLPRGRTYVRNGSVVDLQISEGQITSVVSGSELYKIVIKILPLPKKLWDAVKTECAGKIESLIELLQGRLSAGVMQIVTHPEKGLFPSPKQIDLDCSCPDWADMCKHVAATLYGVGARLDEQPSLLFLLRGVNPEELISAMSATDAIRQTGAAPGAPAIPEAELSDVFGIELADSPAANPAPAPRAAKTVSKKKPGLPPAKRGVKKPKAADASPSALKQPKPTPGKKVPKRKLAD